MTNPNVDRNCYDLCVKEYPKAYAYIVDRLKEKGVSQKQISEAVRHYYGVRKDFAACVVRHLRANPKLWKVG